MGRRSSIQALPPAIREAVDAAIREGRATLDDIVATIRDMGGVASKSAVHRYRSTVEESMEHYRQAQALAKTWAERLPENGDVSQLTRQILSVMAFRAANDLAEGETIEGMEVSLLARAMKDISASAKTDVEARAKIRSEALREATKAAEQVVAQAGLTDDQWALIRAKFLGVEVANA